MALAKDVVESHALTETSVGLELLRIFIINNVAGSAPNRLFNALNNLGIPRLGEFHPSIPDIRVTQRNVVPMEGASTMKVSITYSLPEPEELEADESQPSQIQVTSSVRTEERTKDIFGEEIVVAHAFEEVDADGNIVFTGKRAVTPVSVQVPQPTFRFTRREPESPFIKSRQFVGTVNSVPWFGIPERQALCTHIDGISDDGGVTYQVSYEFQFNFNTWDANVFFTDPDTGRPVEGLIENIGIRRFEVYPKQDFNALVLSTEL